MLNTICFGIAFGILAVALVWIPFKLWKVHQR